MIPENLAECHIQRFNRVSGIDRFPDIRGEGEERDHPRPVGEPRFANCRVLLIPPLAELDESTFGGGFGSRGKSSEAVTRGKIGNFAAFSAWDY
jgi:hypothetical protein